MTPQIVNGEAVAASAQSNVDTDREGELRETRVAEAGLYVTGGWLSPRVEYTPNGMIGRLVAVGLGADERGPLFSEVHFDGHESSRMVKTKYLRPTEKAAASSVADTHPLDALELALPIEEFCDTGRLPTLIRGLVLATIYQARATERLANHLGAK